MFFFQIPMIAGTMADDGVLMAYFLKENIDKLEQTDIKWVIDLLPALAS